MPSLKRIGKFGALLIALSATLAVAAQEAQPKPKARATRGRVRNQGGVPLKQAARPEAADPLAAKADAPAKDKEKDGLTKGTYHYTFKLRSFDGTQLAASYYPSKLGSSAPVVMLIHEASRSSKDFEDPVTELKGQGLAEHLQDQSYAVLTMDLRGQGLNPRRARNAEDREAMAEDLQAAYQFLLDRHNRGDLNVGKLGVLGVGAGANLAAAWAYQPGAAVSTEGRPSDVNALILVSPMPDGAGYVLDHVLAPLALRIPLFVLAGAKDNASKDAVESARKSVERARLNKIELFPSSLHGYKLLRLEPKVTAALSRFLETNLKLRPSEWEPRYNQIPVAYSDIQTTRHKAPLKPSDSQRDEDKAKAKAKADDAKPKADDAKPKADDAPKTDQPKKSK
ncbi:MAG: alpha/beta hydrolase [Paludisphaera borealis]|uniref:alpha/beta hydrolase n=1 Tax=Paludisphaera borealis TaxID=1387353 RepID=UPI00284CAB86|nr:alpha/beta fold hydrolase [Paludisphaera borealis]MDR3619567.1 alpha/beta hydrolase [Paludisphaera borealis]